MKRFVTKIKSLRHPRPSTSTDPKMPAPVPPIVTASSQQSVALETPKSSSAKRTLPKDSLFESIPPEIRLEILSQLNIDDLGAIVHASPVFHQLYLLNRKVLLRKGMAETLHNVVPDAIAVYESGQVGFKSSRTTENVTQFIQGYQVLRNEGKYSILDDEIPEDQIINMVSFLTSTVQPFMALYAQWAQDVLRIPEAIKPLSSSEYIRIARAMYRFQLYCHLFGNSSRNIQPQLTFEPHDILKTFFCNYKPWEVEEILCIFSFAADAYDQTFHIIHQDVHPNNARFDEQGRPPTPDGAFDLDNSWNREQLLHGTLSRGLELLHTVLTSRSAHEQLVNTMQQNLCFPTGYSLEDLFILESPQYLRRHQYPIDEDSMELRRDSLPFIGDTDAKGPPQAWVLIWKGTYSNKYGHTIPETLRRWGYVMWDTGRLSDINGYELLAQQWDEMWDNHDPRDM
ncbi:hypothetical protein B0J11DRAFT_523957 [Dendryphion nanum]|uniref:F-box domain-containing protein n=1 Tax=Dendryphion nanum TaxID=256645 RepID=A0A9P9E2G3_9PLEO|nr:hypothetical protein B0J11DRAFT_523957 [Dendryphion nanum]